MEKIAKIRDMLKERKLWLILRDLEKTNGFNEEKYHYNPVEEEKLISVALEKKSILPLINFKDRTDILQTFQSLIMNNFALHDSYTQNQLTIKTLITLSTGDDYFHWSHFWVVLVDHFGYWRILGGLAVVLSFIPNGLAYKIFEFLTTSRF